MLKKTITYTDYNGDTRTEDFYFNISRAELIEMETGVEGGFVNMVEKISQERDIVKLSKLFRDIILKAYGEKSPDGKRFVKSPELSNAFSQTEAYSELMMELIGKDGAAEDFVNHVISGIDLNSSDTEKIKKQVADKMHIIPDSTSNA